MTPTAVGLVSTVLGLNAFTFLVFAYDKGAPYEAPGAFQSDSSFVVVLQLVALAVVLHEWVQTDALP
jgi:hypothetical protein